MTDDLRYLDDDGNPADEATATRITVTSDGVVRVELRYFGDDGEPAPMVVATRNSATRYDADGGVIGTTWSDDDDDETGA